MKTDWDYTSLAGAYLKRPGYAPTAINRLLEISDCCQTDEVCDIGAGAAHLTLLLAKYGLVISAIEPNDAMRKNGIARTKEFENVTWFNGTGENTNQKVGHFKLVTFGSSFNVCDRGSALKETARILKVKGWFACCWNHRQLNDPIQRELELIISKHLPDYAYGTRRESQEEIIKASGLFSSIQYIEGKITQRQSISDCIEAWRSHGTLVRQAGEKFNIIINEIEEFLVELGKPMIEVPYQTKMWAAQLKT